MRSVPPNRLGFSRDDFIVGQISRIGRGQNQRLLIDAVVALRKQYPHVKMVLVGGVTKQPGSIDILPELREYARPLGDNAVFTGDIEDPFPYLAGFAVATCTGTRDLGEGAPRKLIEPMALGIPCVTTDGGATNEVVDDGVDGFVIEDNNVGQMVARLEQLMLDKPLYHAFSIRAQRKVERMFNIEVQAQKLKQIFLTLLADARQDSQRSSRAARSGFWFVGRGRQTIAV
ncbi:MAG: glycosyltransferase family 4 protein [Candidatus Omnitrophica bacterium]|nr:glycosyltransferase family 4 protein [Candidatus Omnitrophota bacterium]